MADEMYVVSGETLTCIADVIRSKTGLNEQMTVASMASAIDGISGGLPDGWTEWTPDDLYGSAYSGNAFLSTFVPEGGFTAFALVSNLSISTQCIVALAIKVEDTITAWGFSNNSNGSMRYQVIGGNGNCLFPKNSKYIYKTFVKE